MSGRLDGKLAIVTGGARGIGEAIVRRFVTEGARVIVADIREDLGNALGFFLHDALEEGGAAHEHEHHAEHGDHQGNTEGDGLVLALRGLDGSGAGVSLHQSHALQGHPSEEVGDGVGIDACRQEAFLA